MFLLKKALTALILPPSSPLLLALIGLVMVRRRPRLGYSLVTLAIALLWMLSTPWVANELLRGLEVGSPPTPEELARTQAIVILGNNMYLQAPEYDHKDTVAEYALERLRYGARLARATGLPVAIAGGVPPGSDTPESEIMSEVLLVDFGVKSHWLEIRSLDTVENAAFLAPQLKVAGVKEITLVTHAWHMRRAKQAFEKQGLVVLPASTRYAPPGWSIIPRTSALQNSTLALHEWLGLFVAEIVGSFQP
jgi:uncharacterized SAM-binding protein YcdF (DUF218 family)